MAAPPRTDPIEHRATRSRPTQSANGNIALRGVGSTELPLRPPRWPLTGCAFSWKPHRRGPLEDQRPSPQGGGQAPGALVGAMGKALDAVNARDARRFFEHCADTAPWVNCFDQCCRATQPSITLSSTTRKEALLAEGDFAPRFYQTNPFSKVFSRDRGERFGSTVLSGAVRAL